MDTEYISLSHLLQNAQVYERLPLPLQKAMQRSVWITLITGIAVLLVFVLVPPSILHLRTQQGGFFIGPVSDLVNGLLDLAVTLLPYLAVLNLANLFLTLAVLTLSWWMLRPVSEPVHWLAAANAVPAGISAGITLVLAGLFAAIVVISLVIWVIIICVVTVAALGMLAGYAATNG